MNDHPENESGHLDVVPAETDSAVAFEKLVDWLIESDPWQIRRYVHGMRERYPDASDQELARRIVSLKSIKNGFVGAATSVPGFLAFPLAVPADVIASWKIQINMALCIAHLYGHEIDAAELDNNVKTDLFMILAGANAQDSLRVFGIDVDRVTQRTVKRYVTREITIELWKHLGRRIIRTTGLRSMHRLSRVVPLVGAPIGFAFDYSAARSVGESACAYYSREPETVAA